MSLNYAFGFSLFLLILVALNIYFFYTLNSVRKDAHVKIENAISIDVEPSIFKDINEHLSYLPNQYRTKNVKFANIQRSLVHSFNFTNRLPTGNVWDVTENWLSEDSLFPHENGAAGHLQHAIRNARIVLADNAPKGTQLKLLLLLEDKKKLYFKPKWYNLSQIIDGKIYNGFDRHNSEVFAYYLAMVLNFKWIPPSVIRRVNFNQEILPVATVGLKRSMVKNGSGSMCIYGKCYYCNINTHVCPSTKGEIEGAVILYFEKPFRIFPSPWRRSYNNKKKMDWETNNDFCKKVIGTHSMKRILNLVDVAIFDFFIQNGDRHHLEVYKDKIVLLDNGKGLGNPAVDVMDVLAPLYQCCVLSTSTWRHLEMLSGGTLTETIKFIASFQGETLATEDHYKAIERRLLKIYATVQYCIGKHGSAKVFKSIV